MKPAGGSSSGFRFIALTYTSDFCLFVFIFGLDTCSPAGNFLSIRLSSPGTCSRPGGTSSIRRFRFTTHINNGNYDSHQPLPRIAGRLANDCAYPRWIRSLGRDRKEDHNSDQRFLMTDNQLQKSPELRLAVCGSLPSRCHLPTIHLLDS
ncbi:hypothetical protein KCU87_g78, partial [Aureobasidium melanogenum]